MDTREAGRRGGQARRKKLTKKQRTEIARLGGLKKSANQKQYAKRD